MLLVWFMTFLLLSSYQNDRKKHRDRRFFFNYTVYKINFNIYIYIYIYILHFSKHHRFFTDLSHCVKLNICIRNSSSAECTLQVLKVAMVTFRYKGVKNVRQVSLHCILKQFRCCSIYFTCSFILDLTPLWYLYTLTISSWLIHPEYENCKVCQNTGSSNIWCRWTPAAWRHLMTQESRSLQRKGHTKSYRNQWTSLFKWQGFWLVLRRFWLEYKQWHCLSWLRVCMVFLNPSKQILE